MASEISPTVVQEEEEFDETKIMRTTAIAVGSSAEIDNIVAAIAMLLAFPSEVARKFPSHMSLKVMIIVTITCEKMNSNRSTTLNNTKQVAVIRGTEDACIANRNGKTRYWLRKVVT